MPSHSGKRPHDMNTRKWGGRSGGQRRDERRSGSMQNRNMGGARPMVSPWENGVTPGMQSNLFSQNAFAQPAASSYLVNSGMNREGGARGECLQRHHPNRRIFMKRSKIKVVFSRSLDTVFERLKGNFATTNFGGFGNNSNKIRRLERMGGFDDQRGRGLLPSPSNTPLLGVAPPAFPPPARGPEFLQQRMGNPWDSSLRSGGPRGMSSGYYPTNRGRQDNSRKFLKAKRPPNKSSNSKGGGSKEGRGRVKGMASKSPSVREREDKERASSHSKELKSKQGEVSPSKSERSTEGKNEEKKEETKEEKKKEEKKDDEDEDMEKEEKGEKEDKGDDQKDEKEEEIKEVKQDKEKPQEDPFPVKALYCHICDLDSFSSKKGYIRHLQGITHAKMAELFHAKNAATLELLNISAKLAEMRQRDKVLRRTGKKGQPVMKTTEQILVQKWLKVGSCCGTKYKSPFGLEEHKLSIHHLKAKFALKQKQTEEKQKEGEDEKPKEEEEKEKEKEKEKDDGLQEDSHDEIVRMSALLEKAQKEADEMPLSMQSLPVYNPSSMTGLEYIGEELRFRCRICKGQMFKSLENHCQSHAHYDNIATHLNKVEDNKREEERKEEEIKKEKEKEEEKKKQQEEKAKENKVKEEEKARKKEKEEEDGGDLPPEYIMVDCSDDNPKEKSDEEQEMDEDVIPLGEEEERILNATEEKEPKRQEQQQDDDEEEEEDEEDEAVLEKEIFEEIGEKINFDEDLKKQLENGKGEEEEEAEAEAEVAEMEPPPKKVAYTPRRRGRGRGRGRYSK